MSAPYLCLLAAILALALVSVEVTARCKDIERDPEVLKQMWEETKELAQDNFVVNQLLHDEAHTGPQLRSILTHSSAKTIYHVPIVFNVMQDGNKGKVPDSSFEKQLDQLNEAFSGKELGKGQETFIRFYIKAIRRFNEPNFYNNCVQESVEDAMKKKYNLAPEKNLNVFSCNPGGGYLGWVVYFPSEKPATHHQHGVVMAWDAFVKVPGYHVAAAYAEGDTLTHEIGHFFGLDHTFYGGCSGNGDGISDTPAEKSPAEGNVCGNNPNRDTCNGGGRDPWENYMDYTDDYCRYTFSPQQSAVMYTQLVKHKPLYKNTSPDGGSTPTEKPTQPPQAKPTAPPVTSPTQPPQGGFNCAAIKNKGPCKANKSNGCKWKKKKCISTGGGNTNPCFVKGNKPHKVKKKCDKKPNCQFSNGKCLPKNGNPVPAPTNKPAPTKKPTQAAPTKKPTTSQPQIAACPSSCNQNYLGDGVCDQSCNRRECFFDFGDCNSPSECAPGCPTYWLYDDICDPKCNNYACNYDGGDCF